jgi:hypothetical protein
MMLLRGDRLKRRDVRQRIRHSNICICLVGGEGNETQLFRLRVRYALIPMCFINVYVRTYIAVRLVDGVPFQLSFKSHDMEGRGQDR